MSRLTSPFLMSIQKLVIAGVGLIGGSLALALREAGAVGQIVGIGRSRSSLQHALALGVIDDIAESIESALAGADIVVLAAPVAQTPALLAAMAPYLRGDTIVTDAGSTKGDAVVAAHAALGADAWRFVPAHPIAGGELSGVDAARADLYRGKRAIVCPLPENRVADVARIEQMWRCAGALVKHMTPGQHDAVFAAVSHLPHILSYALVAQILDSSYADLKLDNAGAGFRDFTRIAASNPEMWRDICLANGAALLGEIDGYMAMLQDIRRMLAAADGASLQRLFSRASRARLDWGKPQGK